MLLKIEIHYFLQQCLGPMSSDIDAPEQLGTLDEVHQDSPVGKLYPTNPWITCGLSLTPTVISLSTSL